MASKSPSMAFEPTPAIDSDKENLSPLTENHTSGIQNLRLERGPSKVHFSPPDSPGRRAQSLATSVPFLEPVSSASQVPRQNFYLRSPPPDVNMHAYMEQSRALLESQRLNFGRERQMFENERKLWNAERDMLKSRIAALELSLNKHNSRRRRFSNETPTVSLQSTWKDSVPRSCKPFRVASENQQAPAVWETPDVPVTRVFSNGEQQQQQAQAKKSVSMANGLPSISETAVESPVSPRSVPVPIAMLDSSLDGITLRSAGLESSFVKVSPPRSTSSSQPPSPGPRVQVKDNTLHVNITDLPDSLDEKLVRNAGHTPMECGKSASSMGTTPGDHSRTSPHDTSEPALKNHGSSISAATSRPDRPPMPPSERSDSYFCNAFDKTDLEKEAQHPSQKLGNNNHVDTDHGDVELKGPLAMNNKPGLESQEDAFLSQLDARLHAEADRPRKDPVVAANGDRGRAKDGDRLDGGLAKSSHDHDPEVDDGGPRLKLKKSMNFGSAFGSSKVGRI